MYLNNQVMHGLTKNLLSTVHKYYAKVSFKKIFFECLYLRCNVGTVICFHVLARLPTFILADMIIINAEMSKLLRSRIFQLNK